MSFTSFGFLWVWLSGGTGVLGFLRLLLACWLPAGVDRTAGPELENKSLQKWSQSQAKPM